MPTSGYDSFAHEDPDQQAYISMKSMLGESTLDLRPLGTIGAQFDFWRHSES